MLESVKVLRIHAQFLQKYDSKIPRDLCVLADKIETEVAERYMPRSEVSECYMPRPVDADGVPLHIGDSIEYPNGGRDVVRFITVNANAPIFNERGWIASKCRHVKPRTVEDVLADFAEEVKGCCDTSETVGKYADELRELLDGDA